MTEKDIIDRSKAIEAAVEASTIHDNYGVAFGTVVNNDGKNALVISLFDAGTDPITAVSFAFPLSAVKYMHEKLSELIPEISWEQNGLIINSHEPNTIQ